MNKTFSLGKGTISFDLEQSYLDYHFVVDMLLELPDGRELRITRVSNDFWFDIPKGLRKEDKGRYIDAKLENEFLAVFVRMGKSLWKEIKDANLINSEEK